MKGGRLKAACPRSIAGITLTRAVLFAWSKLIPATVETVPATAAWTSTATGTCSIARTATPAILGGSFKRWKVSIF